MLQRRVLLRVAAAVPALAASSLGAAGEVKLAILSAIGDSFTVVHYVPGTGSHLDRNQRELVPLPRAEFDVYAIGALREALRRLDPTRVGSVVLQGALPHDASKGLVDGSRFTPPADIQADLEKAGATRLLLLTRLRAPARLQLDGSATGSGVLEGLGFYVDRDLRVKRSDTGESAVGFLAPFAYFDTTLIDLTRGDVIGKQAVQATIALSAARAKNSVNPWDALDAKQKISVIEGLLKREIERVVPLLFAPG